jgi:hypothetical protein
MRCLRGCRPEAKRRKMNVTASGRPREYQQSGPAKLARRYDYFSPANFFKDNRPGHDVIFNDPKRCIQIKITLFIQTSFAQSDTARPKATDVQKMSLFLVACVLI